MFTPCMSQLVNEIPHSRVFDIKKLFLWIFFPSSCPCLSSLATLSITNISVIAASIAETVCEMQHVDEMCLNFWYHAKNEWVLMGKTYIFITRSYHPQSTADFSNFILNMQSSCDKILLTFTLEKILIFPLYFCSIFIQKRTQNFLSMNFYQKWKFL